MYTKFTPGETFLILSTILEYAGAVYNMQKAIDANDWDVADTYKELKDGHWKNIKRYIEGNFENQ